MYILYELRKAEKWYHHSTTPINKSPVWIDHVSGAAQFRTIESANSKAHEMNLTEYFIEDEHGQTVYPMKPEVL